MYIAPAVIIVAIISLAIGFSVEQAYGQANMTADTNMTTAGNVTGIEDVNVTKGSVSGMDSSDDSSDGEAGLAVSDPGAEGPKKPVKK